MATDMSTLSLLIAPLLSTVPTAPSPFSLSPSAPPWPCVFFDQPPTPTCGGVLNVEVGQTLTFTVQASDDTCTLPIMLEAGLLELPGVTTNPPLPTSASGVVSCVVTWTPDVTNVGTHGIVFHAVSGCCSSDAWCNMTVNVVQASTGCTLTQGYWKTHDCDWPAPFTPGTPDPTDLNHNGVPDDLEGQCAVEGNNPHSQCPCDSLHTLQVGSNAYTQCDLLCSLAQSANGNAVRILAKQLIAAKLNAANGAATSGTVSDPSDPSNPFNGHTVAQLITDGDNAIGTRNILTAFAGTQCGGPRGDPQGCPMVQIASLLDRFNNGFGPVPHCN
jgi:hypothetical protein